MKWVKFERLGAQKGSFDKIVANRFEMNDDACRRVKKYPMPALQM